MKHGRFGIVLAIVVGCGGTSGDGQNGADGDRDAMAATPDAGAPSTVKDGGAGESSGSDSMIADGEPGDGTISERCRGFSFEGLKYSPGGDRLPNTCMPFDPTTNNPYAVRCVDVWPWYKTTFPGDQFCILPPPPDKGVQYGVHPQGVDWFEQVSNGDMSGYDEPSDDFTMEGGEEEERNYYTQATNATDGSYYRNYVRMRPGSHHMIVSASDSAGTVGTWGPGSPEGLFNGTSLPGAQRPDDNAPKTLDKPDEDSGLYAVLPAEAKIIFDMHHFNATDSQTLKEAWTNLWWEDDARTQMNGILGLELAQTRSLHVEPGETVDYHYSWDISQPTRLLSVFGHRHAWTSNFSSWVEKPDGDTEIIYQSFDWYDEPTYRYDSLTTNPVPDAQTLTDGGSSGVRTLNAGEKLHFNCHIAFTDERAAETGAPSPSSVGPLRFANEAFTAEMCILFGSTAGARLPTPKTDTSPLPDFATMD